MPQSVTIAISKGRIYNELIPLLSKFDIVPKVDPSQSRKLILTTNQPHIRLVVTRSTDIPVYVEHGVADLGLAGKDILLEYDSNDFYEPLDLNIAKCQMVLAGKKGTVLTKERPCVATKYPNITRDYFAKYCRQVEIIKLYGAIEISPILGLSDYIVDLMDTGNTLKQNGLVVIDKIANISTRLIVNKAAMKIKKQALEAVITQLDKIKKNDRKT